MTQATEVYDGLDDRGQDGQERLVCLFMDNGRCAYRVNWLKTTEISDQTTNSPSLMTIVLESVRCLYGRITTSSNGFLVSRGTDLLFSDISVVYVPSWF